MLDALREGSPDILLVDRLWCDLHMRPLRRDHLFRPPRPSLFDTADSAALVRYLNRAISLMALFSYLSAIVVRRDVWNAADPADDFIGSAYVHSARLLSAVARGCTVAYLPQALVLCRGDNDFFRQAGEYDRCRLDLHGYRRLIDTYLTDVSFAGPARGIMRREYGLARLLLVVASATPEQQSDLRSYLSYYEYDALRRLAVAAASSDGLHQALARIAPPARRAWWWYHRHADPSGDRRP
jgi:abequosyltransferase